jgi:hypothetical protein
VVIAQLDSVDSAVFTFIGVLGTLGGLGLSWLIYTVRDDRRRAAQPVIDVPRHREHTGSECGSSGDLVRDHLVTTNGRLLGLCPGCGAQDVTCTPVDRTWQYGPWQIDSHEPRIDPVHGLHTGACWVGKARACDLGLCICSGVAA